jgi:predicted nucleotide-binding protein
MWRLKGRVMAKAASKTSVSNDLGGRINTMTVVSRLEKLLKQLPEVIEGNSKVNWSGEVKIVLAEYYGTSSVQYKTFNSIRYAPSMFVAGAPGNDYLFGKSRKDGLAQAQEFLNLRLDELRDEIGQETIMSESELKEMSSNKSSQSNNRNIFVVHGHNEALKEKVARFLTKLDFAPIILHEQANSGRTVIEKFESNSKDVCAAVILLTNDDQGFSNINPDEVKSRARQNVIFEWGYFIGKFGRGRAIALYEEGVELPSDLSGVIYISLSGSWKNEVVKELKSSGLEIDANKLFS